MSIIHLRMPEDTTSANNGEQYANASPAIQLSDFGGILFYSNEKSPSETIGVKTDSYFVHFVSNIQKDSKFIR